MTIVNKGQFIYMYVYIYIPPYFYLPTLENFARSYTSLDLVQNLLSNQLCKPLL